MTKSSITGININWPHDSVHGYLQQVMNEFHYLYSVCQHPPQETGVLKYMSEVFICRGGSGSGGGGIWNGYAKVLEYKIFSDPGLTGFNMPFNIVDNKVDIIAIGGGGGGWKNSQYVVSGGGGGWLNRANNVSLVPGKTYNVFVGKGAKATNIMNGSYGDISGGSSYFDTILSTNGGGSAYKISGGSGGSGGAGYYVGGDGYQFGGGSVIYSANYYYSDSELHNGRLHGGNGGVWGGGGGGRFGKGGDGGYYGGGGGTAYQYTNDPETVGGNGGYYGGGGGGYLRNPSIGGWYNDNGTWKQSGFGGNGGNINLNALNGINAIGNKTEIYDIDGFAEIESDFISNGIHGLSNTSADSYCCGGGGYSGIGGSVNYNPLDKSRDLVVGCGGGGGYGSHGGLGERDHCGGGGGGYFGNGNYRGGGGGYKASGFRGGGGFYSNSFSNGGGGVSLNLPVDGVYREIAFGGGGDGYDGSNGAVILRYYKWVDPRNPT